MGTESNITNTYRTKDIAELLKISDSTIRKYAISMKAAGAVFALDAKGERLFDEHDFKAFSLVRQQISKGRTMKEASIQAAALLVSERQVRWEAGEVMIRSDRELLLSMADRMEKDGLENERLLEVIAAEAAERRAQEARHRAEAAELREELAEVKRQNEQILSALNRMEQGAHDARTGDRGEKSSPKTEEKPEPNGRGLWSRIFGRK